MDYKVRAEFDIGARVAEETFSIEEEGLEDHVETIVNLFTRGNYSCDCNRIAMIFGRDPRCGDSIILKKLTLILPDGTSRDLPI